MKEIKITDEMFKEMYTKTLNLRKEYEKKEYELYQITPAICDWLAEGVDIEIALKLLHAKMEEDETKFAIDSNHLYVLTIAPKEIQEKYPNSEVHLIKNIDQIILSKCFNIIVNIEEGYKNAPNNLIVVDYCVLKDIYSSDFKIIGNIKEKDAI